MLIRHTKYEYSMLEPPILSYLRLHSEINQALLYGCLTEVCVRKTCFDLMMRGYEVYVVVDAVALEAMRDAGANLLSRDMV